ncbi:MAG: hypothetical protein IPP88_02450 [Betaproteobacteria bacterium]|nr:hypothetical protein [Betaproteobacteria bacterium]
MSIAIVQRCAASIAILAVLSVVGCTDRGATPSTNAKLSPATAADIDPRSKVVGVEPAGSTTEAPATTSPVKSSISKAEQSSAMPLPGQAKDHSTLAPKASQKSGNTGR